MANAAWGAEPQLSRQARSLASQSEEFKPEVIEVTPGVHVAVGFGLANSILIEGTDGLIIVDTMEGSNAARAVKKRFDEITTKPVKAIIYTHNHYDHVMGAKVFAGDDNPEIYAHRSLMAYIHRVQQILPGAMMSRNIRQFGILLPRESYLNAGIGPRLVLDPGGRSASFLPPTKTVGHGRTELEIAGVKLHLMHAPGETNDQIYVWLPEHKTLLPGDNFYKSFPNLYAIRGTPYRDPQLWVASLDKMMAEEPEFLVPSHTRPIQGAAHIAEVLTDYRDAIQSVLDQTLEGMNRGLTPDELVEQVKLPAELADKPYLQEYYGTIPWSVRSIYAGNLGWFDGNATQLFPLSGRQRAERTARLAGGVEDLLKQAQAALDEGDHQWAAELADHLLALDPDSPDARDVKARALMGLAVRQTSANARNYYISTARELSRGSVSSPEK
jgi:alkyl sulfatase BDS1-like metallo-beta-lactamase superfamily hydrolase